ncbi:MAG: hypothetical protein HQL56_08565 [Magnetococcales bacterium]|nr:hypothetical protein [Magnetococcales bacterium]
MSTHSETDPAPTYPVTLLERNGSFFLHQPDLNILLSGATADEVLRLFQEECRRQLAHYRELGLRPPPAGVFPPKQAAQREKPARYLSWQRLGAWMLLTALFAILLGSAIRDSTRLLMLYTPEAAGKIMGMTITGIQKGIDHLANLSPQEKKALQAKVHKAAENLRPLKEELRLLLATPGVEPSADKASMAPVPSAAGTTTVDDEGAAPHGH